MKIHLWGFKMKEAFINKRLRQSTLFQIQQANEIIEEYAADNMSLTLRQLYYQFVSRDLIANTQKEYHKLSRVISDGRLTGLVDWDAIEDKTRFLRGLNNWANPGHLIESFANRFHMDHWEGQKYQVEVWIEKEALIGVISRVCNQLDVDYFACKGYVSQSEMYTAARRTNWHRDRELVIIHLGDHDPSGMDMTRDITDRMKLLTGRRVKIERIALNFDQVEEYQPPPNPAKLTDSRADDYIAEYGHSSWELDALSPSVIRDLIINKVLKYRNNSIYKKVLKQETKYRKTLEQISENWEDVDWENV